MSHNVLCLGLWQIGWAIKKIEEEAGNKVYYKTRSTSFLPEAWEEIEVMHTSIMYEWNGENFFKSIKETFDQFKPKMIINHGTCPVGTMNKLHNLLGQEVAHSPVNGKHPDLYVSIKYIFTKFASELRAVHYLLGIGISKVEYMPAQLLITTAYGWDIL